MSSEGATVDETISTARQIWLRAFYGFDPEGAGYIGFTRPADHAEMLSKMRAGDLVLIYGAVESLTQQDLRAQALGFLQVTEESCDDRSRMSETVYQWKIDRGFKDRWNFGIKVDRAWRIRNKVHIKSIAPEAFDNIYRFERTTRARILSSKEVKRALSHPVTEVSVFGEPIREFDKADAPLKSYWMPSFGPRPSFGSRMSNYVDGESFVYLMELEGLADRLLGRNSTHSIFKVGRSNEPKRREDELNAGFPPSATKRWKLIRAEKLKNGDTAHDVEEQLKAQFHIAFNSEGGEFFTGQKREVETAFTRVCASAMHRILGASGRAAGIR